MRKKRSFTLIEVLIALTLACLLMSTLFFWYRHLNKTNYKLQKIESVVLEERYFEQRLSRIFSEIHKTKEDTLFFSTENNSLIFHFENGAYIEPKLSGIVLGKLFVNPKNHFLYLGLWPKNHDREPSLTIPLLSQVKSLELSFYNPPQAAALEVETEEVGPDRPKKGWQSHWKDLYKTAPEFIKLRIIRFSDNPTHERVIEYVFELKDFSQKIVVNQ